MRGFLIVCATVLVAIAIGVSVIALQRSPDLYMCPSTRYCLDLARVFGVRGPFLVPSEQELKTETGLVVKDRISSLGDPSLVQTDQRGKPVWSLRYDLSDPRNHRFVYFFLTNWNVVTKGGTIGCRRQLVANQGGLSVYVTSAVAPGGRRFCYVLKVGGGQLVDLEVWGGFGSLGYEIRSNIGFFKLFPGGAASPGTLHWVENVVGSLKTAP